MTLEKKNNSIKYIGDEFYYWIIPKNFPDFFAILNWKCFNFLLNKTVSTVRTFNTDLLINDYSGDEWIEKNCLNLSRSINFTCDGRKITVSAALRFNGLKSQYIYSRIT